MSLKKNEGMKMIKFTHAHRYFELMGEYVYRCMENITPINLQ